MAETLPGNSFVIKQSTTLVRPFFFGTTSATLACTLSKNGGTFNANQNGGAALTEIANGWYNLALTAVDTNTTGILAYHITGSAGGPADFSDYVQTSLLGMGDIALTTGAGLVTSQNTLRQSQAASLPFTMTKSGVPVPAIGPSITAQRNFGSGWTNCVNNGTYSDQGFGLYFLALTPTDTAAPVSAYRFTSTSADDNIVIIWFSP